MSGYWTGKKRSEETKRKISETKKGSIPWNKGKTGVYSKDHLKRMSENSKGQRRSRKTEFKRVTFQRHSLMGRLQTKWGVYLFTDRIIQRLIEAEYWNRGWLWKGI